MCRFLLITALTLLFAVSGQAQEWKRFFPEEDLMTVGAYYYPEHWPEEQWDRDLAKIAEMGFTFTHFAEFAWAQLEPEEGVFDFAWLDMAVALADKHGLKVIMCTSTATPPVWLVRKHPEVLITHEDGRRMDHGARQHASFSNEYYRGYSQKLIAELARRYGQDERIIGWQLDNEPRSTVDYSEDALKRFRLWLQKKYGNIDALNQAWGTNFWSVVYSDWSEINLPQHQQWGMNLYQRLDHGRFADEETSSFLDEQALTIRQHAAEWQWITTNFIPMYDARFIGQSKELDFITYTRYMVYGEHEGLGPKGYRVGEYSRIAMANDYFRPLSPLMGVMELQPGQVNWGTINSQPLPGAVRLWLWHIFAGDGKFVCTYRFRAPIYGYEKYHYGIVGPDGVTVTPGGHEYQQFMEEVERLRSEARQDVVPADYAARKTGILYDPDNYVAMQQNKQTTEWDTEAHVLKYYKALKSLGAPVDFVRDTMDFSTYPVMVVPAYQQMSKPLIDKLTRYTEQGGHLVMSVRTAHQNEKGHLWETPHAAPIYHLLGASIPFYDLLRPHAPDTVVMEGERYGWTSWGDVLQPEEGTESWASFAGDFYEGQTAVTHQNYGQGSVTYVGADSHHGRLEQAVINKLFKRLELPVENYPPGVLVEYRDGLGIAMNYSDKDYEMTLPKGSKILVGQPRLSTADVLVWRLPR